MVWMNVIPPAVRATCRDTTAAAAHRAASAAISLILFDKKKQVE
jgi:hypothetical protein